MDKQSYAFSQMLIKSDLTGLVRQAPASLNVYLPGGKFQLTNQGTQAAYNIDTVLPLN